MNKSIYVTATNREFLNIFKTLSDTKEVKDTNYAKVVLDNSESIMKHLADLEKLSTPSQEFIDIAMKAKTFIDNKDEVINNNLIYCSCGSSFNINYFMNHIKTIKHIKYYYKNKISL